MAWSLHLLSEIRYMGLRRKIVRDSVSYLEPATATALAQTLHTPLPLEPASGPAPLYAAVAQIYIFTIYPRPKFTKNLIYPRPKFTHLQIYTRPKFTQNQIYPWP